MRDFAVERQGFDLLVRLHEDATAGGFIHAPALHADEAVFHQIHAADSVFATQFV